MRRLIIFIAAILIASCSAYVQNQTVTGPKQSKPKSSVVKPTKDHPVQGQIIK